MQMAIENSVVSTVGLAIASMLFVVACGVRPERPQPTILQAAATPLPSPVATQTPSSSDLALENFGSELYGGRVFESRAEYGRIIEVWDSRRPPYPGLSLFARGASAGLRFLNSVSQLGAVRNDKWQHCVWGAEIALAADLDTAKYHAWLKEFRDLTDGDISTSFDEVDFEATLDGARQVAELGACEDCTEVCELRWGDRAKSWSGSLP